MLESVFNPAGIFEPPDRGQIRGEGDQGDVSSSSGRCQAGGVRIRSRAIRAHLWTLGQEQLERGIPEVVGRKPVPEDPLHAMRVPAAVRVPAGARFRSRSALPVDHP